MFEVVSVEVAFGGVVFEVVGPHATSEICLSLCSFQFAQVIVHYRGAGHLPLKKCAVSLSLHAMQHPEQTGGFPTGRFVFYDAV